MREKHEICKKNQEILGKNKKVNRTPSKILSAKKKQKNTFEK